MKKSNNKKHPVSGKSVPAFSYRTEPNYFYAFIGPMNRDELDEKCPGGEGAMRIALQNTYRAWFGSEESCSSGWGVTPQQKDDVSYSLYDDGVKKALIQSYYTENKPMPRALRAWELFFQEEEKESEKKVKQTDSKIDRIIKSRERIWARAANHKE